jgi:hypothetical protein
MDTRATISGILAGLAIISGTILAALNLNIAAVCFTLASTFGGYVVGLYSEPHKNKPNDETEANHDA